MQKNINFAALIITKQPSTQHEKKVFASDIGSGDDSQQQRGADQHPKSVPNPGRV